MFKEPTYFYFSYTWNVPSFQRICDYAWTYEEAIKLYARSQKKQFIYGLQ